MACSLDWLINKHLELVAFQGMGKMDSLVRSQIQLLSGARHFLDLSVPLNLLLACHQRFLLNIFSLDHHQSLLSKHITMCIVLFQPSLHPLGCLAIKTVSNDLIAQNPMLFWFSLSAKMESSPVLLCRPKSFGLRTSQEAQLK